MIQMQTVLDVACGTGVLTRDVSAELGAAGSVTGLDPAPGMLAAAQEIALQHHRMQASRACH